MTLTGCTRTRPVPTVAATGHRRSTAVRSAYPPPPSPSSQTVPLVRGCPPNRPAACGTVVAASCRLMLCWPDLCGLRDNTQLRNLAPRRHRRVIPRLHDQANIKQSSNKRPAKTCIQNIRARRML